MRKEGRKSRGRRIRKTENGNEGGISKGISLRERKEGKEELRFKIGRGFHP